MNRLHENVFIKDFFVSLTASQSLDERRLRPKGSSIRENTGSYVSKYHKDGYDIYFFRLYQNIKDFRLRLLGAAVVYLSSIAVEREGGDPLIARSRSYDQGVIHKMSGHIKVTPRNLMGAIVVVGGFTLENFEMVEGEFE